MEPIVLILAFTGILTFVAMKSTFFGLKLMAGMSWIGFVIWFRSNAVAGFEPGTGTHTAILVVAIGFALMIVLAGLGRGIARSKKWETGEEQITGGFKWQLPNWMKWEGENKYQRRSYWIHQRP